VGFAQDGLSVLIDSVWVDLSQNAGFGYQLKCVVEGNDGNFYFGHRAGVTVFDGFNWNRHEADHGFNSQYIDYIGKLEDGTIWASSYSQYSLYNGNTWSHHNKPDQAVGNNPMIVANDNCKWFCSSGGIYRVDNGNITFYNKEDNLMGQRPRDVVEDPNGDIWVMTQNGVCRYHSGIWVAYPLTYDTEGYNFGAFDLELSLSGNPIFAVYNQFVPPGSAHYEKEWLVFELTNQGYEKIYVYWWYYDYSSFHPKPSCILPSSDNSIWVGTTSYSSDGCLEYSPNSAPTLHSTYPEGTISNKISDIYEDSYGHIWLVSTNGVSRSTESIHVSVPELDSEPTKELFAYPNPSSGNVTLALHAVTGQDELLLYDMAGSLIQNIPVHLTPNTTNSLSLNLQSLSSGMYVLQTSSGNYSPIRIIIN